MSFQIPLSVIRGTSCPCSSDPRASAACWISGWREGTKGFRLLPSHGSYSTSHQCLLEKMTPCKRQQRLCFTLLFPDVALTMSRLLQKHPKKIIPIALGPSEVALPDQGYVPGVLPVFTLQVLSNIWLKRPSRWGEEEQQEQDQHRLCASRRGRHQAWKLVGCCPHASGIRESKFRRHQHGQGPPAVGWVRGKVPHLPGRDCALPPLSSAGRQERVPKAERIALLHLLDRGKKPDTFNEIHVEV